MSEAGTNELALIRAAVDGDDAAFQALVQQYSARLRWLIRLRLDPAVRARVSADDVLQDVLLVVNDRIQSLVVEHEGAFWTWLCRVVEQRLIDARRRHLQAAQRDARRERPLDARDAGTSVAPLANVLADPGTSPSAGLRTVEQRQKLEQALEQLPPSYREVIVLRVLEGLSVSDTAEIMGRSNGAISVLLTKAVKRLGSALAEIMPLSATQPPDARDTDSSPHTNS